MNRIAFFDLDRTLLSVNSASGWIKREVRLGFITRWQAARAGFWVAKYHLGFSKMEQAIADAVATMKGEFESELADRTRAYWAEDVVQHIRGEARSAVEAHKAAGDRVVLLTSSSNYLSDCAVEAFGLDHALCNRFEVVDGQFTGAARRPLCFGAGKVHHAEAEARAHGVSLRDCTFYTDSYSDLPGLEAVGEPIVVTPDPRLRRHAMRVGWPIEDWGKD